MGRRVGESEEWRGGGCLTLAKRVLISTEVLGDRVYVVVGEGRFAAAMGDSCTKVESRVDSSLNGSGWRRPKAGVVK